jgi:type I site-specific restriction endonuclease
LRKANDELCRSNEELQSENEKLLKFGKKSESSQNTKDLLINRLQEEVERLKANNQIQATAFKEQSEHFKKVEDLNAAEIKKLERQKQELLSAFKKQLQLIDVLRKQKVLKNSVIYLDSFRSIKMVDSG